MTDQRRATILRAAMTTASVTGIEASRGCLVNGYKAVVVFIGMALEVVGVVIVALAVRSILLDLTATLTATWVSVGPTPWSRWTAATRGVDAR